MIRLTPPVRFVASVLTLWFALRFLFWTPAILPQLLLRSPNPFFPGLPALPLYDPLDRFSDTAVAPESISPIGVGPMRDSAAWQGFMEKRFDTRLASAPEGQSQASASSRCGVRCTRMLLSAHMPPMSQPLLMRFARRTSRTPPPAIPASDRPSPFSLSGWAQWRSDTRINSLANDGELGGSQAGIRAQYRIATSRRFEAAVSARISTPLERSIGAEAALGVTVRPRRTLPVELTVERRIALDSGGRDAWSLGVAGGLYRQRLPLDLELDGYAQAGIVGLQSRDLYGEGAIVVSRPIPIGDRQTLSLGAGTWAGAQPGVSRLDIGPEASLRLPVGTGTVRLSLSWRQRIAGAAAPGSGPVLSLGTDF